MAIDIKIKNLNLKIFRILEFAVGRYLILLSSAGSSRAEISYGMKRATSVSGSINGKRLAHIELRGIQLTETLLYEVVF